MLKSGLTKVSILSCFQLCCRLGVQSQYRMPKYRTKGINLFYFQVTHRLMDKISDTMIREPRILRVYEKNTLTRQTLKEPSLEQEVC